jgi:hypothetical protein
MYFEKKNEKARSINYSECAFVAPGVQHAMHMGHIVICGLSGSTIFFSILSHKRHGFRKKKLLNSKCVLFFSLHILSGTLLILRRKHQNVIKN